MALKLKLSKADHEALDEPLRALYVDDGKGGFILDAEDAGKIEEFRTNNRTYAQQLEQWKALGLTPEQAKAMIETARKAEEGKLSAADLQKKFEQQLADRDAASKKTLDAVQAKLDRYEILEPMRRAALDGGVIPGEVDDFLEKVAVRTRFGKDAEGKLQIFDAQGTPILGATPKQLIEELKPVLPRWYQPLNPGGSGIKTSDKPADPNVRQVASEKEASLEDLASGKAVVAG